MVPGRQSRVWVRCNGSTLDAVSGQAAYFGIVDEGAASAIVTIRIRVEDSKITEAEWYLGRRGDPGLNGPNLFDTDNLTANPPPDRVVPKAQRVPRDALLAIVNSYFDGITSHDGAVVLAHPGCNRVENGVSMTGRRGGGAGQRGGGPAGAPAAGAGSRCRRSRGRQRLRFRLCGLDHAAGGGATVPGCRRGSRHRARDGRVHPRARFNAAAQRL